MDIKGASRILEEIKQSTNFLPSTSSINRRMWHIENSLHELPKCKMCSNYVKWHKKTYLTYCSMKCRSVDPSVRLKREKTNIERYGSTNPFQSETIKEKIKQTCMEKYGVEYARQSEIVKNKIRETSIKRYGCDSPLKNLCVRKKIKNTMKERYGVEYPLQNETIKKEAIQKIKSGAINAKKKREDSMLNKYGVKHNWSDSDTKKAIKETNIKRYGVENFTQLKSPSASLIQLNNKEYMMEQHHTNKKSMKEIAMELGVDGTTISHYLEKLNIPKKYWNNSIGQNEVAEFIGQHVDIIENTKSIIPPLELDLYIPSHKLAIEYCGLFWHSELNKDKNYHLDKLERCKERGIRLLTIFEDEWTYKQDIIKRKLLSILGQDISQKVFARKCSIVNDVSTKTKRAFYNQHHIQGDGPGSIHYGLIYENKLVACMSFIKQKNSKYYLNRYTTNYIVPGGFSKLLKHFIDQYRPKAIITFADRRWSNGNLYKINGFVLDKTTHTDYRYIIREKTYHKFGFRHIHLKNILGDNYNSLLTEHQNCFNNGIYRIYDCGLLKYSLCIE